MAFRDDFIQYVNDCFDADSTFDGERPSLLLVDFVLDKYKMVRNFPDGFSDEKIEKDMTDHKSILAMAVVDLFVKTGAEGETSHTENGVSRTYESAYVSNGIFKDVLPFVKVIS